MLRTMHSVAPSVSSSLLNSPDRKVCLSHILVDQDQASVLDDCEKELQAALAAGERQGKVAMDTAVARFGELAGQHSQCAFSAKRGGAIGWLDRGVYYPSVELAAYATPVGSTARATSPRGHHLLLVTDER
jgi:parvulin-like peptidyl-prolyl isomerase